MTKRVIYCVVPRGLAAKLHDPLRSHFLDDPSVEVIVERRRSERRRPGERREAPAPADWRLAAGEAEGRRIRNPGGRRVGERRAPLVPVAAPLELPRRLRHYATEISFLERVAPSAEANEDLEVARIVTRIQAGDRDAFAELYLRYFDRVYGYLRVLLRDTHEAEDATQQVFAQVLERIATYERRGQPFRAYLFVAVRNLALSQLRKHGRLEVQAPSEIARRQEARDRAGAGAAEREGSLLTLDWITDRDLLLFVERLPDLQRQVLLLRFMLDLRPKEISQVIGRPAGEVRVLQTRAVRFLRERLVAIGRTPESRGPARSRQYLRQAPVLRARRFALHA